MGLRRIAISNPSASTDTKIFTASNPYLLSIVATNKSASTSNIRVWVQPSGASAESQYAFIVYELPVDANNSYETLRFAINPLDDVYIRSDSASVNFQAYGLVQYDIKLGVGVSSYSPDAPANPINGMIWVDSDGSIYGSSAKPIYIYNATTETWDSTAAPVIDTSTNYTWTGTNNFSASTSIGDVSSTEIAYINGVTSSIQNQLDNKEKTIPLQSTEPISPNISDLWVDSVSMQLKVYNGSSWVALGAAVDDSQLVLAQRMFA